MVQGARGARLALETLQRLRVFSHRVGKEFERHAAPEARVFGAIHYAHAPAAQFFLNAIM
jgi:hypothetical protein